MKVHTKNHYQNHLESLSTFLLIAGSFIVLFLVLNFLDNISLSRIFGMLIEPNIASANDTFQTVGDVIVGILGIAITVVAIIVELAANRYSSRIVDLFIKDKINYTFLAFLTLTSMLGLWHIFSSANGLIGAYSISVTLIFMLLCISLITPYFVYVFKFLKPNNIIYKIEQDIFKNILISKRSIDFNELNKIHMHVSVGVDQLSDIALNAVRNKDKTLSIRCIRTMRYLLINYLQKKKELPDLWFKISPSIKSDIDFLTMTDKVIQIVSENNIWLENKLLKQYFLIYKEALNNLLDVSNYISMCLNVFGIKTIAVNDKILTSIVIRYFNSLMRSAIDAEDNASANNTLDNYRKFADHLVDREEILLLLEICHYIKIYGLEAKDKSDAMSMVLITASYDLYELNKRAFTCNLPQKVNLLQIFLTVDQPLEEAHEEIEESLMGVRQTQIMLAAFYLNQIDNSSYSLQRMEEARNFARMIYMDILDELALTGGYKRIVTMIQEIKYARKEFSEINIRDFNFKYISTNEKRKCNIFLDWINKRMILMGALYILEKDEKSLSIIYNSLLDVAINLPENAFPDIFEVDKELPRNEYYTRSIFQEKFMNLQNTLITEDDIREEFFYQRDLNTDRIFEKFSSEEYIKAIIRFFTIYEKRYKAKLDDKLKMEKRFFKTTK